MNRSTSTWITKRRNRSGKVSYLVRWIETDSGKNRGKTFARLDEARVFRAQVKNDLLAGTCLAAAWISYESWVKRHLAALAGEPGLSPLTVNGHREALDRLAAVCRPRRPGDITPRMIRYFRQAVQVEGCYSPVTVNKWIKNIRAALSYAVRDEIIPVNRLLGRHKLFLPTAAPTLRILEVGEIQALFNAAVEPVHRLALSLAFYGALRRGEIAWLQWRNVDLSDMLLTVEAGSSLGRRKNGRVHTLPLRAETAALLQRVYPERVNEYIFTNPLKFYHVIPYWFAMLCRVAGVDKCSVHDVRRSCNTLLLDGGCTREAAMQILGQSSLSVNERYYTGVLTRQRRLAVDALPTVG